MSFYVNKNKHCCLSGRSTVLRTNQRIKAEMNRFYSASDSDTDALKQAIGIKNTKKSSLSWMRVFNNWKITHSYKENSYLST